MEWLVKIKVLIKTALFGLILGLILEFAVFNFSYFNMKSNFEENITINQEDIQFFNWNVENETYITGLDPMIVLENIDKKVKNIRFDLKLSQEFISSTIFHTTNENEIFGIENMDIIDIQNGENFVEFDKFIHSLRLDLGEYEGLELKGINIIINYNRLNISISRIIAVILIFLSGKMLFSLQDNPDYGSIQINR